MILRSPPPPPPNSDTTMGGWMGETDQQTGRGGPVTVHDCIGSTRESNREGGGGGGEMGAEGCDVADSGVKM